MVCPTNIVIVDTGTPCNEVLEVDLLDYIEVYPVTPAPTFELFFYSYEGVSLDGNILSIELGDERPKEVNASLRLTTGGNHKYVGVVIKFKNICEDSGCSDNEYCDPCTGVCVEGEVDINATVPEKGRVKLV